MIVLMKWGFRSGLLAALFSVARLKIGEPHLRRAYWMDDGAVGNGLDRSAAFRLVRGVRFASTNGGRLSRPDTESTLTGT
jgi:hypothetical protein